MPGATVDPLEGLARLRDGGEQVGVATFLPDVTVVTRQLNRGTQSGKKSLDTRIIGPSALWKKLS